MVTKERPEKDSWKGKLFVLRQVSIADVARGPLKVEATVEIQLLDYKFVVIGRAVSLATSLTLRGETMSDKNQSPDTENQTTQDKEATQNPDVEGYDADLASSLDRQRISPETGRELQELRNFIDDLVARANDTPEGGSDLSEVLTEWHKGVLEELPQYEIEDEDEESRFERAYTVFPLEHASGGRTYRINVNIDNNFGGLIERVRRTTDIMLERVLAGRTRCFIETARRFGLTPRWRRSRSLPFPHPLPYMSPPPTTDEGRFAEEAGVIEAALHFPLSQPAPGINLFINQFSQGPSNGFWVLGSATVNLYNDSRFLRIRLNSRAYPEFTDNTWAGTIAHEILHNLGWGHPDGVYESRIAIVNYDRCIRRATSRFDEDIDDRNQIR
jgi:hypothetical protein